METLTPERIAEITKEYNEKRKQYDFPTTSCSENGIKSMFDNWPELMVYTGDELIHKLACINYHLAFD